MKRNVSAAAILLAFDVILCAQSGVEKAQNELDAALTKGDKAAYNRLLTDDFTWIGQDGLLRDKKAVVDDLQPAPSDAGTEGVESRPFPGGVVLFGTRRYPKATDIRFLRLWVQRDDRWQLAAHQGSPIGNPAVAAPRRSSPMPPDSGSASEIKAIEQAIAALAAGNSTGDAKNFAASVTDGFVAINAIGGIASKQDRMTQLAKRPDAGDPPVEAASTRIYGDLAVTIRLIKPAGGQPLIQMIIHAKQSGRWLRAATIATARNPLVLLRLLPPVAFPPAPLRDALLPQSQTRTRLSGARYSFCPGCTLKAAYHASRFRTVSERNASGA